MPTPLEKAARAASRRMKGRGAQLEESPEHRIKVSRKRKPRKGSRRERVEHGESPRGRTNDN